MVEIDIRTVGAKTGQPAEVPSDYREAVEAVNEYIRLRLAPLADVPITGVWRFQPSGPAGPAAELDLATRGEAVTCSYSVEELRDRAKLRSAVREQMSDLNMRVFARMRREVTEILAELRESFAVGV